MKNLSIIIPLCNALPQTYLPRLNAVNFILNRCFADQTDVSIKVIYVEQSLDGTAHFLPYIEMDKTPVQGFRGIEKILICAPKQGTYENTDVFVKGWCVNVGVMRTDDEYIMVADSDIFQPNSTIGKTIDFMDGPIMDRSFPWCFAWNAIYYTTAQERERVEKFDFTFMENKKGFIHTPKPEYNEGGWVIFKRKFFLSIGMCNEHILMLGGPDNELARRAEFASKTYPIHGSTVYHLWHPVIESRWVHKPRNSLVYAQTKKHTEEAIFWLTGHDLGNPDGPLHLKKEFMK